MFRFLIVAVCVLVPATALPAGLFPSVAELYGSAEGSAIMSPDPAPVVSAQVEPAIELLPLFTYTIAPSTDAAAAVCTTCQAAARSTMPQSPGMHESHGSRMARGERRWRLFHRWRQRRIAAGRAWFARR